MPISVHNPLRLAVSTVLMLATGMATADEHCGTLGDCRAYFEINSSDGDVGFHVLFDGDGWSNAEMRAPDDSLLLNDMALGNLGTQTLTERFFESAEPPCEASLADGEDYRTLTETLALFPEGEYSFDLDSGESEGSTELTHNIPAAPAEVDFDGRFISWEYGDDLGECTTWPDGFELADEDGIAGYEVVMEPDADGLSHFKLTIRVPAGVNRVRIPRDYLRAFEPDTPMKIEVGAIEERDDGTLGNQTFTEEDGFCARRNQKKCEVEDEE